MKETLSGRPDLFFPGHRAEETLSSDLLYAESRHSAFNEVVRRRILAGNYFLLKRSGKLSLDRKSGVINQFVSETTSDTLSKPLKFDD